MSNHSNKSAMLRFLASPREAQLIKRAAEAQDESASEFMRASALAAARAMLESAKPEDT